MSLELLNPSSPPRPSMTSLEPFATGLVQESRGCLSATPAGPPEIQAGCNMVGRLG